MNDKTKYERERWAVRKAIRNGQDPVFVAQWSGWHIDRLMAMKYAKHGTIVGNGCSFQQRGPYWENENEVAQSLQPLRNICFDDLSESEKQLYLEA